MDEDQDREEEVIEKIDQLSQTRERVLVFVAQCHENRPLSANDLSEMMEERWGDGMHPVNLRRCVRELDELGLVGTSPLKGNPANPRLTELGEAVVMELSERYIAARNGVKYGGY